MLPAFESRRSYDPALAPAGSQDVSQPLLGSADSLDQVPDSRHRPGGLPPLAFPDLAAAPGLHPGATTPHPLRHCLGLSSAMAGVSTTGLMRAMGHRSPIVTARYSEFAGAERRWAFA